MRPSLPYFPRRPARGPELFQHRLVAKSVHFVPETTMLECHHLSHSREPYDRRAFPAAVIAFDQVKTARRQNEKAAVDQPTIAARLFEEGCHRRALAFQSAVAPRRPHGRNCRQLSVTEMKIDRRPDIQIAQPVAISETESWFILDIAGNALEASAGQRVFASVDQRHAPWLDLLLMNDHA